MFSNRKIQKSDYYFSRIVLLFMSVLPSVYPSATGHEKFGCTFQTDTYDLESSVEVPIWGSEEMPTMIFENDVEFKETMAKIERTMNEVIANNIYDDIEELAEFFIAYDDHFNQTNQKDFQTFYDSYHPKYNGHKNSPGLAIELYERLVLVEPRMKDYYYLIAAGAGIDNTMLHRVYRELNPTQMKTNATSALWPYPYHNHVAGFIQISVANRKGYVLMDVGFALKEPIVFMEDAVCPNKITTWGSGRNPRGERFEYELASDGPFITAHSYVPNVYSSSYYWPRENHLYFFGRPYCSFLDTTVKPNLALPRRSIEKRNPHTGKVETLIEVSLFSLTQAPTHHDRSEVNYVFTFYNETHEEPISQKNIPLFRLGSMKDDDKPAENQFQSICTAMSLHPDLIRTRITQLCGVLFTTQLHTGLYEQISFLIAPPADDLEKQQNMHIRYEKMDKERRRGKFMRKLFSFCS